MHVFICEKLHLYNWRNFWGSLRINWGTRSILDPCCIQIKPFKNSPRWPLASSAMSTSALPVFNLFENKTHEICMIFVKCPVSYKTAGWPHQLFYSMNYYVTFNMFGSRLRSQKIFLGCRTHRKALATQQRWAGLRNWAWPIRNVYIDYGHLKLLYRHLF